MKKDAYYFSHDSNARNDQKIISVRIRHGAVGYAAYFMIIEMLRDTSDYTLKKDYNNIAFDTRIPLEVIKSVVEDFGLFEFADDYFFSPSLKRRMEEWDEKRVKNSLSGKKGMASRWKLSKEHNERYTKPITNVTEINNERYTENITNVTDFDNKKRKEEEKKEEERKEKENIKEKKPTKRKSATCEIRQVAGDNFQNPLQEDFLPHKHPDTETSINDTPYTPISETNPTSPEQNSPDLGIFSPNNELKTQNGIKIPPEQKSPQKSHENASIFTDIPQNAQNQQDNSITPQIVSPYEADFKEVWNAYGRKGNKKSCLRKWNNLSEHNKAAARKHIPLYVAATPDKQFRKNFETYINQECWNDELPINQYLNNQNYGNKERNDTSCINPTTLGATNSENRQNSFRNTAEKRRHELEVLQQVARAVLQQPDAKEP